MHKNRLEAFSDGVIAIIITIMVLEFEVPEGATWQDLWALWPVFLSYALSFAMVGIYWNNHHHLMHTLRQVNGRILWANLNWLFWLSLMPFATAWMGEHQFAAVPTALYGIDLCLCGLSYILLQKTILSQEGHRSVLAQAIGRDYKGKVSMASYVLAVPLALWGYTAWAGGLIAVVALIWLVPDPRIERALAESVKPLSAKSPP